MYVALTLGLVAAVGAAPLPAQTLGDSASAATSYAGGGQSASANKLLTYDSPLARSTSVPAGTISYPVTITYSRDIDPSTLEVSLNGANITSWFYPAPGTTQTVAVPLGAGRTVLKFSVKGIVGSRTASDGDSFSFVAR
jgi:hypothetical protein